MKKKAILCLLAAMLFTSIQSFALNTKANNGKAVKKEKSIKNSKKYACSCTVSNLTQTGTNTFTWNATAGWDHFNYGGYYQAGGTFSGTAYGTSLTLPSHTGGGRISVVPVCPDGTQGTGQNILFN